MPLKTSSQIFDWTVPGMSFRLGKQRCIDVQAIHVKVFGLLLLIIPSSGRRRAPQPRITTLRART